MNEIAYVGLDSAIDRSFEGIRSATYFIQLGDLLDEPVAATILVEVEHGAAVDANQPEGQFELLTAVAQHCVERRAREARRLESNKRWVHVGHGSARDERSVLRAIAELVRSEFERAGLALERRSTLAYAAVDFRHR